MVGQALQLIEATQLQPGQVRPMVGPDTISFFLILPCGTLRLSFDCHFSWDKPATKDECSPLLMLCRCQYRAALLTTSQDRHAFTGAQRGTVSGMCVSLFSAPAKAHCVLRTPMSICAAMVLQGCLRASL